MVESVARNRRNPHRSARAGVSERVCAGKTPHMATYRTAIRTPLSPSEAFTYMADLRNFAEWDPGVTGVEQVVGNGDGPDAEFDVTVKAVPSPLTLRYKTIDHQPPDRVLVRAESKTLVSVDEILVEADGDGAIVTYDAELTLKGVLRLFDPFLGLAFRGIGDRAAAGMRKALEGEKVDR